MSVKQAAPFVVCINNIGQYNFVDRCIYRSYYENNNSNDFIIPVSLYRLKSPNFPSLTVGLIFRKTGDVKPRLRRYAVYVTFMNIKKKKKIITYIYKV